MAALAGVALGSGAPVALAIATSSSCIEPKRLLRSTLRPFEMTPANAAGTLPKGPAVDTGSRRPATIDKLKVRRSSPKKGR